MATEEEHREIHPKESSDERSSSGRTMVSGPLDMGPGTLKSLTSSVDTARVFRQPHASTQARG